MKFRIEEGQKPFFYDVLLCLVLYLIAVSLPAPFFLDQASFTCMLRLLVLLPICALLLPHASPELLKTKKGFFLCLPFLILCFGNLCSLPFASSRTPSNSDLVLQGFFTLITAGVEEILFRYGVCSFLARTNLKRFRIPISALLFGLTHLLGIFGGAAIVPTLAQAGYTCLLGLLLGIVYEFGGFVLAILFHFFFNFLQNDLFLSLGGGEWNIAFFAFNIGFYVICVGYAYFLNFNLLKNRCGKRTNP